MTPEAAIETLKLALSQANGGRATIHPTRLRQIIEALERQPRNYVPRTEVVEGTPPSPRKK